MTIIRRNGKVTTTTRILKRERRYARRSQARQTNGIASLKNLTFLGNLPTG